jgi:hypothetical protein
VLAIGSYSCRLFSKKDRFDDLEGVISTSLANDFLERLLLVYFGSSACLSLV